jgi:hypothetical protein
MNLDSARQAYCGADVGTPDGGSPSRLTRIPSVSSASSVTRAPRYQRLVATPNAKLAARVSPSLLSSGDGLRRGLASLAGDGGSAGALATELVCCEVVICPSCSVTQPGVRAIAVNHTADDDSFCLWPVLPSSKRPRDVDHAVHICSPPLRKAIVPAFSARACVSCGIFRITPALAQTPPRSARGR